MATFSQFTPYVQPEVPGAPVPLVEDAILYGAREFASRSWAIRSQLPVTLVAGTRGYLLIPSLTEEVVAVSSVTVDGNYPITAVAPTQDMRMNPVDGTPTQYWVDGQTLTLYPTPDQVLPTIAEVVTMPVIGSATIPDTYLPYVRAVAAWARYTLMSMVGQTWSNPEGAAVAMAEFQRQVHLSRYDQNTGKAAAPVRVRTEFF